MAITYSDYTGDGVETDFAFSFPYLEDTHVVVEVDGVDKTTTAGDFTLPTTSLVRMTVAPADAADVRVKRVSDFATDLVDFTNGSVLTESDLDRAYQHNRYLNEEAAEGNDASMQIVGGGTDYNAANKKIVNLADPTLTTDATNKDYVDTQVALSGTNLNGFESSAHTGDNTAVDFTLSFTPQVSTPEAFLVTIDGVVQKPTTAYTIHPDTPKITFTSAPPTSAVINVVAISKSSTSADSTTVKATGSTTARSLAARVADVINILDYGASTSNTAAANTTAIDAAITSALSTGKPVYVPIGVFECNAITVDFSGAKHFKISGQVGGRAGELLTAGVSCLDFTGLSGSGKGLSFPSTSAEEYMGLHIQDLELRGPSLQAGPSPSTNTTGLYINKGRDVILDNVHITEFRTGLHATNTWSWHDQNCKIARCHVGAKFDASATYGAQAALHTKLKVNDCTYGVLQESSGHTYLDPWFEGQPPTNDREMEYAVVIGAASGSTKEINFIDGWWEQIQNYPVKVGYYDNGSGGNAVVLANSASTIDDIRISTYGHWDSVGNDVSGKKIDVNASATNITDYAVRVDGELSNWGWTMVNGDATKATSTYNFENHVANGQRLSQFSTALAKGAQGNVFAGMKTGIADNTATDVLSFSIPNRECGAMFRLDYVILADNEHSMAAGSVLLTIGRKNGYAAQGAVGTPTNTNLVIRSTYSMSTPVFAFNGFGVIDAVSDATETATLRLTQDNSPGNYDATFTWRIEELSSARQADFQSNFITVSQA